MFGLTAHEVGHQPRVIVGQHVIGVLINCRNRQGTLLRASSSRPLTSTFLIHGASAPSTVAIAPGGVSSAGMQQPCTIHATAQIAKAAEAL